MEHDWLSIRKMIETPTKMNNTEAMHAHLDSIAAYIEQQISKLETDNARLREQRRMLRYACKTAETLTASIVLGPISNGIDLKRGIAVDDVFRICQDALAATED